MLIGQARARNVANQQTKPEHRAEADTASGRIS